MKKIIYAPRYILAALISAYQMVLSPDHSWLKARFPHGFCRHYPTCSEYSKQVIVKHGVFKGGYLAAARIVKCNPWASPSLDPIP